jgi:hypothetical protein
MLAEGKKALAEKQIDKKKEKFLSQNNKTYSGFKNLPLKNFFSGNSRFS